VNRYMELEVRRAAVLVVDRDLDYADLPWII
jgi:hypothetical protein